MTDDECVECDECDATIDAPAGADFVEKWQRILLATFHVVPQKGWTIRQI